jgi:hypothetical protein
VPPLARCGSAYPGGQYLGHKVEHIHTCWRDAILKITVLNFPMLCVRVRLPATMLSVIAPSRSATASRSTPGFRVNFLFVPGFCRYSDANPEQITAAEGQIDSFRACQTEMNGR